jgi:hypothetical protein
LSAAVFFTLAGIEHNNLCTGGVFDLIHFFFANMFDIQLQIATTDTDNPKTGFFFTFFDFASFANKNFAHIILLFEKIISQSLTAEVIEK